VWGGAKGEEGGSAEAFEDASFAFSANKADRAIIARGDLPRSRSFPSILIPVRPRNAGSPRTRGKFTFTVAPDDIGASRL